MFQPDGKLLSSGLPARVSARDEVAENQDRLLDDDFSFDWCAVAALGLYDCPFILRALSVPHPLRRALRRLWVQSPYLPSLLSSRDLRPEAIALVLAASTAVRLVAGPVAGRLADRLDAPNAYAA
jgi:hypothetical protein